MGIRLSDQNINAAAAGCYYTLPSASCPKGANVACVAGIFFRTHPLGLELNQSQNLLTRVFGAANGNDAYFRLPQAATQLDFAVRNFGVLLASGSVTGLTAGTRYLLLVIANPLNFHVICAPTSGGTPLVTTVSGNSVYAANMGTNFLERLFGATGAGIYPWAGEAEHAFYLNGSFPEASDIPDNTLIVNLATGAQDINTLDAQLTGGAKRWWYPLRHNRDLSDAWGLVADLTTTGENLSTGLFTRNGQALRPETFMPSDADFIVSQARFATIGNASTATADVPVQGGTYTGITPAAIQARLVGEDGTTHVDWTVIDPAPTGGTWAAGTIPDVPMVAGVLALDMRPVDGGGSALAPVKSAGTRGVGLSLLNTGQSQLMFLYQNGAGLAIPAGSRLVVGQQNNTGMRALVLGSAAQITRGGRRGIRQALIEWDALFPGVPAQFVTIGESGTPIENFLPAGDQHGRWAALKTSWNVVGPYFFAPMGHSSDAGSDYETQFTSLIAEHDAQFGSKTVICLPVSRYKRASAGTLTGDALAVHWSRRGMRAWHEDNRSRSFWGASMQPVFADTGEASSAADPHPQDSNSGQGRMGSIMAWVAMSAARAVQDEVIGIIGATGLGTGTITLTLGRINDYPAP